MTPVVFGGLGVGQFGVRGPIMQEPDLSTPFNQIKIRTHISRLQESTPRTIHARILSLPGQNRYGHAEALGSCSTSSRPFSIFGRWQSNLTIANGRYISFIFNAVVILLTRN